MMLRSAMLVSIFLAMVANAVAYEKEAEKAFPAPGGPAVRLVILSSTDTELMAPLITSFQEDWPSIEVDFIQASSRETYRAVLEKAPVDLVISSAMDLQTKLANDGYAMAYRSDATLALPEWAVWRDSVIGFTEEPAVIVYSETAFAGKPPQTRFDLINALRRAPARFTGRIASYDPEVSGLGYLFATQDAQQSDVFWRLAEVMGGLSPRLSASSSRMIGWADSGEVAVAYNVLGSYARRKQNEGAKIKIVEPEDYTLVMLRTAIIPKTSAQPEAAGRFIDFLLSARASKLLETTIGLQPIGLSTTPKASKHRPILLGPGLLVYLDRLKRQRFFDGWRSAIVER